VSLGKIGKRLKREAKANPKKAVLLGLVTLVAFYFWMPLVWGWIQPKTTEVASMPQAENERIAGVSPGTALAAPAASVAPSPSPGAAKRPSWRQIEQARQEDPRTRSVEQLSNAREPFGSVGNEPSGLEVKHEQELPPPRPMVVAPSEAGLGLSSTIIGSQRRVAQINGKTYAEGQHIELVKEPDGRAMAYRLVEVHPRRVVLEADGQRFDLTLPEPGDSGKMELK